MKKHCMTLALATYLAIGASLVAETGNREPHAASTTSQVAREECTRPMAAKNKAKIHKLRAKEAKQAQRAHGKGKKQPPQLRTKAVNVLPYTLHTLKSTSSKGSSVEIENGAIFTVYDYDTKTAGAWKEGTPLQVTPNGAWFSNSNYEFSILNCITNESVQAKLSLGPEKQYTIQRIISINKATGELIIASTIIDPKTGYTYATDSGIRFMVSTSSANWNNFITWEVNDAIIVGTNNSWFTWGYNYMLINVTADATWVTASA